MDYLSDIIESSDLTSLQFVDTTSIDPMIREIIEFILKNETFSAEAIGLNLSIDHAKKYLDLCDGKDIRKMKMDLIRHIVKIKNEYDDENQRFIEMVLKKK